MLLIIIENSPERNRFLGFEKVKKNCGGYRVGVASAVVSR